MSYDQGSRGYDPIQPSIAADSRARFVARTYTHLLGAIAAFTVLEVLLFQSGIAASIAETLLGTSWLFVLGGFLVVSWIASRIAHTVESVPAQYAALGAYVLAQAIIFVPLIYIAEVTAPGVVRSAAAVTLFGFAGLTAVALITRKDFSFLRGVLLWGGVVALVLIVAGALFGFELGTFFSVAMVALAGAAILYDTSNVIHHFREDRYVAAALELFASVALMFWYVIRLFLSRD
jgi:FtsH-binding integral membrane protein